jgi:signal transduction histidine kinase
MRATLLSLWPKLLWILPFLAVSMLLVFAGVVSVHQVSQLGESTKEAVGDDLEDILLATRMRRDLDHVRLLADEHVYEKKTEAMAALDARIAAAQADYDVAADEFESLPILPEERARWRDMQAARASIKRGLAHVLALSRANDDEPARRELDAVDGDFVRATAALTALGDMARRRAHDMVPHVEALQRSSTRYLALLAGAGATLAIIVGLSVTQILWARERLLRLHTERVEASNEDLDAFAGRVAHDLRAPLTTATLTAQWLSRHASDPEQRKKVDTLRRSLGRMDAIIQDLLTLSRIGAEEPEAACDPAAVTEQLREELASRAEGSSVSLTIDVQKSTVHCSEGLLRQMVWNLAENAMKYRRTDIAARVQIRGHADDGTYVLAVRDNGIGISREDAQKVFDPFFRASACKNAPGAGLGLSIVKRAVEANGGTVCVASEPGHGSEFVVRLPLAGPASTAVTPSAAS